MPRGVNDQFLRILKNERKGSLRAVVYAIALAPLAYFMAELTDEPLVGRVVLLAAVLLAAGVGLGVAHARWRTNKYNASLRDAWNSWMRMSLSCTRVDEVARHVAQKPHAPAFTGPAAGAMLVLNAALFAFLWSELAWAETFGIFVTGLNGLVLGYLAGEAAWRLRWARQFTKALDELITEGQVGLWGEV